MQGAMPCREVQERIYEYLDDEMTRADRTRLAAHLRNCPPCGELARGEQAFLDAVRARCGAGNCPESVRARVAEEIRRRRERRSKR